MRWFMILAVAALTLADPAPVRARAFSAAIRACWRPTPFRSRRSRAAFVPGGSGLIPFASGSPVEFGLNRAFWNMAASGYGGPFANYFSPLGAPRSFLTPFAVNPNGLGVVRPLMVPATPGPVGRAVWQSRLAQGLVQGEREGQGPLRTRRGIHEAAGPGRRLFFMLSPADSAGFVWTLPMGRGNTIAGFVTRRRIR